VAGIKVPLGAELGSVVVERLVTPIEGEVIELYRDNYQGLLRYALTIIVDHQMAEDAIQESFLRFFLARTEGQTIRSPAAWLYRVLRNLLLDERKRAWFRVTAGLEAAEGRPDWDHDPERRLEFVELSTVLSQTLSGREMECLRLRLEGMAYREIASVLKIRPGTVAALLARGMEKVQRIVGQRKDDR
jgi:RNA polymerase sigma-70 factor (ECF subfamily)